MKTGILIAQVFCPGKSDPYVQVMREDHLLYKTAVKTNTLNPDWNEQFAVHLQKRETKLNFKVELFIRFEQSLITIQVFDFDISSADDLLGEAMIGVPDIELSA